MYLWNPHFTATTAVGSCGYVPASFASLEDDIFPHASLKITPISVRYEYL